MTRQDYYPVPIPQQVLWLQNFANTLPEHRDQLRVVPHELDAVVADARWLAYVVGRWRTAARNFAKASTAGIESAQTGREDSAPVLPVWTLPPLPEGVEPRLPGALKRIFRCVAQIKADPGYTEGMGALLGILPRHDNAEHPLPTTRFKVLPGPTNQKVAIRTSKHGRYAVLIQSRRAEEDDWADLAISARHLYEDVRPLLHPGQPELRHYRLRFWDGGRPLGDWTEVVTLTVGP
ncbi:MAG: hypothetical protein KDK97_01485 [Verrucomicrobiales bacterium]|nr:hypothetical protein [Verrucomicrobiales bacterium]MCP5560162.1 hypothetical protein [Verrucomicrobiaceae bacterium]